MGRFLRVCAAVALGLIGLVVVVYVGRGLIGTLQLSSTKAEVRSTTADALPAATTQAHRVRAQLRQAFGDGAKPSYSFTELSCDMDSIDAGWIAQDYEQVCSLRTVDLFPLRRPVTGSADSPCRSIDLPEGLAGTATVQHVPTDALDEGHGWPCPRDLLVPSRFETTRVVEGERPSDLSSSPGWLVTEARTPVSTVRVGCSPWGVIFCSAPFDPVLPR